MVAARNRAVHLLRCDRDCGRLRDRAFLASILLAALVRNGKILPLNSGAIQQW